MASLLLITLLLPLAGAAMLHGDRRRARAIALAVSLATFCLTVALVAGSSDCLTDATRKTFAETDLHRAALDGGALDVHFHVALDGLSLWLFALTSLLSVTAVLVSWEAIEDRAAAFYRLLLVLETGMLGVFVARDIILFYVFFEFTLLPLFFIIGLWGGSERRRAAVKFFLFTLTGSLLTFLGLLAIVLWHYFGHNHAMTFNIAKLTESLPSQPMPLAMQLAVFVALFAGFAVKTPLFPLHTWLPLAHVEAPTAGSVLLAGVLLKVGPYGFLRFCLPMTPAAVVTLMPWLLWISLAGILYGALVALAQSDIKRLVAYSSVSHLGFCMLGIFAANALSVRGGTLQMISHGLATGGLFAVVGMLYERFHTREMRDFGGLAARMPRLTFFAFIFALSSIGLPGLAGFASEFPLLAGIFQHGWASGAADGWQLRTIAVLSFGGVILGAWYMLSMCRQVFFGPMKGSSGATAGLSSSASESHRKNTAGQASSGIQPSDGPHPNPLPKGEETDTIHDLSAREVFCLAPLAVMILWIGLQPQFFFNRMGPTLDQLTASVRQAALPTHYPLPTTH
jgi:NADH-quinone oxidoreductase subunit M